MQLLGLLKTPAITTTTTVISTTVSATEDDDGPFFDLEFPLPLKQRESPRFSSDSDDFSDEDDDELGCMVSSECSYLHDPLFSLSPSDDLFYKGHLVSLHPPKTHTFPSKPAAKFHHVFRLSLPKKPNNSPAEGPQSESYLFRRFKLDDLQFPSVFRRQSSTRSSVSSCRSARISTDIDAFSTASFDGKKRLSKDSISRSFGKLYNHVSKRYGEKASDDGEGGKDGREFSKAKNLKFPKGLKGMYWRFRRSRSASVASVRSPTLQAAASRRDDSLFEQQDGIQSAIAHCKSSLCRGSRSPLMRSRSDPGDGLKKE